METDVVYPINENIIVLPFSDTNMKFLYYIVQRQYTDALCACMASTANVIALVRKTWPLHNTLYIYVLKSNCEGR